MISRVRGGRFPVIIEELFGLMVTNEDDQSSGAQTSFDIGWRRNKKA
jgi:hypothetical protein